MGDNRGHTYTREDVGQPACTGCSPLRHRASNARLLVDRHV